jgi:SpoVK/Ycf46/Vps4 family AAA+-type ATPase
MFIDEIDAIVGKRSLDSSASGVQERVLATLLNEMDGIEVLSDVIVVVIFPPFFS